MKLLKESFSNDMFILGMEAPSFSAIVDKVLAFAQEKGDLNAEQCEQVRTALLNRQRISSMAIGRSVAVPHCYLEALQESLIIYVRLARPLNFGGTDGSLTRHLFFLLGPEGVASRHLDTLANLARLTLDDELRYDLGEARDQQALIEIAERYIKKTQEEEERPIAPVTEGLEYTGKPAGGLIRDIRRRLPWYLSDFRDGLNMKAFASVLFMYFACLAPTVTFGAIMADQTGDSIGTVEMIVATAFCGVLYALFSGQPLVLLGGTGPILVFITILYQLCQDLGLPFLPTYFWVGMWTALLTVLLAVTDASCLMRFFTRFTYEIFAALISVIFIYEAVRALVLIFQGLEEHHHHSTALLSLLLALGTFYIALNLQSFRRSRYLLPWVREFFSDFGPAIAILLMALVAMLFHEVDLAPLKAPDSFSTTSGRGWLINPFHEDLPSWVYFGAIIPALLGTVLVYLDQNITVRIINSPDHNLKKGEGYHLGLGLVGVFIGICSMFGLPWLVAATVRSLNHLRSLATVEEEIDFAGNRHDRIIHVHDNRLTPLLIHLLVGASLLLLPLLKAIPLAVLYGLFLYMGIVSVRGNQFFERLSLWPMESALYPSTHYIRQVPLKVIHKYTLLQLICLVVLWVVKLSVLGILFPLFIAFLVPVRIIAGRYFKQEHLEALDSEERAEEEEERRTE